MADKDDFGFDEDLPEEEVENWGGDGGGKGGGRTRMLLLVLLLVVIAAAAVWFFVLAPADGPSPPVKVVAVPKKPIAMPAPPSNPAPVPVKPAAAAPAAKPVPAAPKTAKPVPAAPATAAAPASTAAAPAADKPAPAATPAPATSKPVAANPAPVAPSTPASTASKPAATPAPAPATTKPAPVATTSPATGAYRLNAGAYLLKSNVNILVKKLRSAGYEPVLSPLTRKIKMIRLLVGRYSSSADAVRKLKEIRKFDSDAFTIKERGGVAVFAGSYISRDQARAYADRIYESRGIQLQEENALVKETLQLVTFGSFATANEAKAVARKLSAKGISAQPEAVR